MWNFNVNGNVNNVQNESQNSNMSNNSNNQYITIKQLNQIKEEIKKENKLLQDNIKRWNKFWWWILGVISWVISWGIVLIVEKIFFK